MPDKAESAPQQNKENTHLALLNIFHLGNAFYKGTRQAVIDQGEDPQQIDRFGYIFDDQYYMTIRHIDGPIPGLHAYQHMGTAKYDTYRISVPIDQHELRHGHGAVDDRMRLFVSKKSSPNMLGSKEIMDLVWLQVHHFPHHRPSRTQYFPLTIENLFDHLKKIQEKSAPPISVSKYYQNPNYQEGSEEDKHIHRELKLAPESIRAFI